MYGKDVLGGTPAWWNIGFLGKALATGSTLLNSLVSYWPLNEQSGTRSDVVGSNDLTDNNTVGAVNRGPQGTVASFVAANTESLSLAGRVWDGSSTSITFAQWIYMDLTTQTAGVLRVGTSNYIHSFYCFADNVAGGRVGADYSEYNVAGTEKSIYSTGKSRGGPAWYFVVAGYDLAQQKPFISVDGEALIYPAAGIAPQTFASGSTWLGGVGVGENGVIRMGDAGVWTGVMDAAVVTSLFASGNGKTYADLTTAEKVGLVSYWNLDEVSDTRADSHGANDLTDNNTVGSATSVNGAMDGAAASFVAANSEFLDAAIGDVIPPAAGGSTISFWLKTTDTTAGLIGQVVNAASPGLSVWMFAGQLQFIADPGDYGYGTNLGALNDGNWHLVIANYDSVSGDGYGYIDAGAGVKAFTRTPAQIGSPWGSQLNIGRLLLGNYLDGLLDEVAIWSRVLTSDERAELFNAGAGKFYPFT